MPWPSQFDELLVVLAGLTLFGPLGGKRSKAERMTIHNSSRVINSLLRPIELQIEEVYRDVKMSVRAQAVFDCAVASLDRAKVAQLQRFARLNYDDIVNRAGFKYLDILYYLADKARWIVDLDLDRRPPESILDLGVGAGHFPFLARTCGHQVLGVDLDDDLYARILSVYSVPRIVHRITPDAALPISGKFDLVSSLQLTYNHFSGKRAKSRDTPYWTPDEWSAFFLQISKHLNYPCRIFFGLNRQPYSVGPGDHAYELMDLFARHGAAVNEAKYSVLFSLYEPL